MSDSRKKLSDAVFQGVVAADGTLYTPTVDKSGQVLVTVAEKVPPGTRLADKPVWIGGKQKYHP